MFKSTFLSEMAHLGLQLTAGEIAGGGRSHGHRGVPQV
jgi:hypothetical protein